MVCASCFHFKPLFENRVTDCMCGKTQVPVSSPLNVPFMARHRWGSPKNPLHWCGRCEKKHNGRGQFTFQQWKVYKFRKPAWLDDMRHPLSRRLSSHSVCGKISTQHHLDSCKFPGGAFTADSFSVALIWSKCLSSLRQFVCLRCFYLKAAWNTCKKKKKQSV